MSNYSALMATINANIKANGNQEITGPVLNAVLAAVVNVMGTGYRYMGVAEPTDDPGDPDNRVVYIANEPGEYTDFNGVVVPDDGHVYLLVHDAGWIEIETPIYYSWTIDDLLAQYAKKDGIYPNMIVGAAQGFLAPEVSAEYTKRISAAGQTIRETGRALITKLYGRSLVWNQLIKNGDFSDGSNNWIPNGTTISVADNILSFTGTRGQGVYQSVSTPILSGRKYAILCSAKSSIQTGGAIRLGFSGSFSTIQISDSWTRCAAIAAPTTSDNATTFYNYALPATEAYTIQLKDVICIDLTQMFGAGNEPSTVAEFEVLYPLPYYASNAGTIINNTASGIKTVGFNQWDEEWEIGNVNASGADSPSVDRIRSKNFIPVFPNRTYYFRFPFSANLRVVEYDGNRNGVGVIHDSATSGKTITLSANARYIRFVFGNSITPVTTYQHDICINLSDTALNGTYKPYETHTLQLNITGWRSGGDLIYPDGMRGRGSDCDYANVDADGYIRKTTKVWESRAYQAGDESDASVITDGVSTLYKLSTPETLTLDTPIPVSYLVQNGGTEERLPEDTASAVSAPIAYDVQYTMDSRAIASPLFVNGTTDADNNFTPDAGQPSLIDAATAYLAGRRVILHIMDDADEFVQDVVAWDGPSGGLQSVAISWGIM